MRKDHPAYLHHCIGDMVKWGASVWPPGPLTLMIAHLCGALCAPVAAPLGEVLLVVVLSGCILADLKGGAREGGKDWRRGM